MAGILENAKTRHGDKSLANPLLWGNEEEYGVTYPEGYTPPETPTSEELDAIIKGGPLGKRQEEYDIDLWRQGQGQTGANPYEMNSEQFLRHLDAECGNPYEEDPVQEAEAQFRKGLPGLWQSFFKGEVPWGGKLSEEYQKQWMKVMEQYKVDTFNKALKANQQKKDERGEALKNWKMVRDEKESAVELTRKREDAETALRRKEEERQAQEEKEKRMAKYRDELEDMPVYNTETGESTTINKGDWPDFKKEHGDKWSDIKPGKKPKETGTLTEGTILDQIDKFALDSGKPELRSKMYDRYLELKKTMKRENAYNQMMKEFTAPETKTAKGMTFEKQEDGRWTRIK